MRAYVIGVDEVGRGPLAGPVCVSAVALPRRFRFLKTAPRTIRDSKRLTARARSEWAAYVRRDPRIRFAVAFVSPRVIDRLHIHRAANRAATRAVVRILSSLHPGADIRIFTDGSLHVERGIPFTEIIRGDEKLRAIQLASIVAKVARDKRMLRLHEQYPLYGFDRNKGYGTREHERCIMQYGISDIHRLTFVRKWNNNVKHGSS